MARTLYEAEMASEEPEYAKKYVGSLTVKAAESVWHGNQADVLEVKLPVHHGRVGRCACHQISGWMESPDSRQGSGSCVSQSRPW